MRKILNRASSSSSLRNYDDMMKENARILIQKLDQEQSKRRTAIHINNWFTWIAFDVVATACLGESFDCLRQEPFRGWPGLVSKTWKIIVYASVFKSLVPAASTLQSLLPTGLFLQKEVDKFNLVLNRTKDRVQGCLEGRTDFLSKHCQGKYRKRVSRSHYFDLPDIAVGNQDARIRNIWLISTLVHGQY